MIRSLTLLVILSLAPLTALGAQEPAPLARICLAPSSVEASQAPPETVIEAVRETFTDFLTGPRYQVVPLTARLPSQAREQAVVAGCDYVLLTSVNHVRKTGSGLGRRIAGRAAQEAAWAAAGASRTPAGRIAAGAAAGAASSAAYDYSATVLTRDELTLIWKLERPGGSVALDRKDSKKAESDGQNLLYPLAEKAAEAILGEIARQRG
jgi:hypothetical protein